MGFFIRLVSVLFTVVAFFYYILGMLRLNPLFISGLIFFIALLITIRLFTPSGKKPKHSSNV
ncbi:MAG TPA: hypothetical protein VLK78_01200 [Candidatus Angelobacter sp.]|nr:hypothetical protein [Candidatus Angelobacter sp.]